MAGLKMTSERERYLKKLEKNHSADLINALIQNMNGEPLMDICRKNDFSPVEEKWLIKQYMEMRGMG